MLKFIDGRAVGVSLACLRAPLFLRVVQNPEGKWDGLDQLGDGPRTDETIHVYRKVSDDGVVFLDYTDRVTGRRQGRAELMATYAYHEQQPDEATARDMVAWRKWCIEQRVAQHIKETT